MVSKKKKTVRKKASTKKTTSKKAARKPATAKKTPAKGKPGRPSKLTQAISREICARIADGETLLGICRDTRMPARSTVMLWLYDGRQKGATKMQRTFSDNYARAREDQVEAWSDEVMEISDDGTNDWVQRELKDGRVVLVCDREHVSRSALRVKTRLHLMAKRAPKKYGDKIDVTSAGDKVQTGVIMLPAQKPAPVGD